MHCISNLGTIIVKKLKLPLSLPLLTSSNAFPVIYLEVYDVSVGDCEINPSHADCIGTATTLFQTQTDSALLLQKNDLTVDIERALKASLSLCLKILGVGKE